MLMVYAQTAAQLLLGGAFFGQAEFSRPIDARVDVPSPSFQVETEPAPVTGNGIPRGSFTIQSGPAVPVQQPSSQGRPALGVSLTADMRIFEVTADSPAEQMGLKPGDQIISLNGDVFESTAAFVQALRAVPLGQDIQLVVDRNGQRMTQSTALAAWSQLHYRGAPQAGTQYPSYSSTSYLAQAPVTVKTHTTMKYPLDVVVPAAPQPYYAPAPVMTAPAYAYAVNHGYRSGSYRRSRGAYCW
jgi:hypothetical protein